MPKIRDNHSGLKVYKTLKPHNMNTFKTQLTTLVLAIASIFSFTACDDDWIEGFNRDIDGAWEIVGISGYSTNYKESDHWYFDYNGHFESAGYGGLNEKGYWERRGNKVAIYFESNDPELVCTIGDYDDDYMVLRVRDYGYGEDYILRMVRIYDRSLKK